MPELSVIVPVYKVEPYLRRCIESILNQTFRDFELILIDDGSPDGCGAICDEYADKDSRIIVIHQENQGVSAARNAGLDIARGTWLGFVDSDDWIEPEMYETMIATAKEKNVDIVACSSKCRNTHGEVTCIGLSQEGEYYGDDILSTIFVPPFDLGHVCWNKIFFFPKIQNIRFVQGVSIGEDGLFCFSCFRRCGRAVKIPDALYNLCERLDSATQNPDSVTKNANSILESRYMLLRMTDACAPEIIGKAIDKYLNDCIRYYTSSDKTLTARMKLRGRMLKQIFRAWRYKFLPQSKINGYIYEWIRLK